MIIKCESDNESQARIDLNGIATDPRAKPKRKSRNNTRLRIMGILYLFNPFYLND
jgi:hypothetical protein